MARIDLKPNENVMKNKRYVHELETLYKISQTLAAGTRQKEALAEVIWDLREEGKCWATYEVKQSCFHVVSR